MDPARHVNQQLQGTRARDGAGYATQPHSLQHVCHIRHFPFGLEGAEGFAEGEVADEIKGCHGEPLEEIEGGGARLGEVAEFGDQAGDVDVHEGLLGAHGDGGEGVGD